MAWFALVLSALMLSLGCTGKETETDGGRYKKCICGKSTLLGCVDDLYGRITSLSNCKNETSDEVGRIHLSECVVQQACLYQWRPRRWSPCSAACGKGTRRRYIRCVRRGKGGRTFPEPYCRFSKKPIKEESCTSACGLSLTLGEWSECSASCGGGYKYRTVKCLKRHPNGTVEDSFDCDIGDMPNIVEPCNEQSCGNQTHPEEQKPGVHQALDTMRHKRRTRGAPTVFPNNKNHWIIRWYQNVIADVGDRVSAVRGTHLTLRCRFNGDPLPSVTWVHNGEVVDYIFDANMRIYQRKSGDAWESLLKIKKLSAKYNGEFVCVATNRVGYALARVWVRQIIQGQATIMSERKELAFTPQDTAVSITIGTNVTIYDGAKLTLKCPVRVIPPRYVVRWRKQGSMSRAKIRRTGERGNDLTVVGLSALDGGMYSCEARSLFGDDVQNSFIRVLEKTKPKIFGKIDEVKDFGMSAVVKATIGGRIIVKVGSQVTISCPVTGVPKPKLQWKRRGLFISFTNNHIESYSEGRTFVIPKVTVDDSDTYTCVAKNMMGSAEATTTLKVVARESDQPKIIGSQGQRFIDMIGSNHVVIGEDFTVVKGKSLVIECKVTGAPPPKIHWSLNGKPIHEVLKGGYVIDHTGTAILLLHVEPSMEGIYTCKAENYLGKDSASSKLAVAAQLPPKIRSGSQLVIYGETVNQINLTIGDQLKTSAGRPLTIKCPVSGVPKPTIIWKKDKKVLEARKGIQFLNLGKVLRIHSLTEKDSGKYECFATNPAGVARSFSVLNILAKASPVITTFGGSVSYLGRERKVSIPVGTNITVSSGKTLRLDCPYETLNRTEATVTWKIDGNDLAYDRKVSQVGSSLVIRNVQLFDEGLYTCVVTNEQGKDKMVSKVKISASPHSVDVENQPRKSVQTPEGEGIDSAVRIISGGNFSVVEGQTVEIKCPLHGSPRPIITWWRNQKLIQSSDRYRVEGGVLILEHVRMEDAGEIACRGTSRLGNSFSRTALTVLDTSKPVIKRNNGTIVRKNMQHAVDATVGNKLYAVTGMTVRLSCPAVGYPKPKVEWFFMGADVESNRLFVQEKETNSLVIPRLNVKLEGTYNCTATNVYGKDTGSIEVITMAPTSPRIVKSKNSLVARRNVKQTHTINIGDFAKVFSGQDLLINCNTHGVPAPNIIWKKDGRVLRNTSGIGLLENGTLKITNIKEGDSGKYLCLATNSEGVDSFRSRVVVLAKHVAMILPSPIKEVVFADPNNVAVEAAIGSNVTTVESKTLHITCKVQGDKYDGPVWFKYGGRIRSNSRVGVQDDGTLVIKDIRVDDAGWYKCQVANDGGFDSVSSFVKVAVPADRLIIRPKQKAVEDLDPKTVLDVTEANVGAKIKVLVGKVVSLQCPTQGSIDAKVSWFQDGTQVSNDNSHQLKGAQLILSNLLKPGIYNYSCRAETFLGHAWMSSSINVVEPTRAEIEANQAQDKVVTADVNKIDIGGSVRARLGSRMDIHCKAKGIPPPKITWFKDGQKLTATGPYIFSENGMVLTVPAVKMESAGEYTCTVSNGIEDADKAGMRIEVFEPVAPNFDSKKSDEHVVGSNNDQWYNFLEALSRSHGTKADDKGRERQFVPKFRAHSPPVVSESEEQTGRIGTDYSVLSGTKLTLKCPVIGAPKPFLIWRKERKIIAKDISNLVISKLKTDDMGVYTCTAENAFGSRSLASRVYVIDPQKPKIEPPDGTPTAKWKEIYNGASKIEVIAGKNLRTITGTTVVINCPAIGIPRPVLEFYKDGRRLNESRLISVDLTNGLLVLRSTSLKSMGTYKCVARNKAGQIERSTEVHLLDPTRPSIQSAGQDPKFHYGLPPARSQLKLAIGQEAIAYVNTMIKVKCAVSGFPKPLLLWTVNDKPISNEDNVKNTSDFHIQYYAPVKDRLVFRCTAVNAAGTVSGVAVVKVIESSKPFIHRLTNSIREDKKLEVNITIGQNAQVLFGTVLRIECPATGAPKPSLMWSSSAGPLFFLPQAKVINDGHTLLIKKVTKQHAITFKCIASSIIGSASVESRITVADTSEPQIVQVTGTTKVTDATHATSVLVGTEVNAVGGVKIVLECHVSGSPIPKVTWKKDGEPFATRSPQLPDDKSAWFLTLGPIQASDAGKYTCVAKNSLGQDMGSSVIKVGARPRIQPVPLSSRTLSQFTVEKMTVPIGTKIEVISGSSLTLQCLIFGNPYPSITWYKNNIRIQQGSRYGSQIPGLLEVSTIGLADEGTYTCVAQNLYGKTKSSSTITVVVPPSIDAIHENITAVGDVRKVHVTVGSRLTVQRKLSVSISCPAYGHPRPKVQWIRKDSLYIIDPRIRITADNTFRIDNVETSDSGTYICMAKNIGGTVNVSTTLIVGELPSAQLLPVERFAAGKRAYAPGVEKHRLIVKRGEDVTLNCLVDGDPMPKVSWVKDNKKLKIDGWKFRIVENQLKIKSVKELDKGKYSCKSINVIGETAAVISLIVGDAPVIMHARDEVKTIIAETIKARIGSKISVVRGSNVLLICDPAGHPEPEIEWSKNGKLMYHFEKVRSGELLTLMNITSEASGNYTCAARNGLGIAFGSSQVYVVESPEIVRSDLQTPDARGNTAIDLKVSQNREISVLEGSVVKLECSAQGYPPPKISWKQDHFWIRTEYFKGIELDERGHSVKIGNSLVAVTTSTLTIASMDTFQAGMYTCMAHNDAGMASSKVILKTRKRPEGNYIGLWVASHWLGCGRNCTGAGRSIEKREVFCSSLSGERIVEDRCNPYEKPQTQRECHSDKCRTAWNTYAWQKCSERCGEHGVRRRLVRCTYIHSKEETNDKECEQAPNKKPESFTPCNRFPCREEDCVDSLIYCKLIPRLGYCEREQFKTNCCVSCKYARRI